MQWKIILLLLCVQLPALADWYNSGWAHRVKVSSVHTQVDADLTDYPVYVDLSDLPDVFFDNTNAGCVDIRVTSSDGTTEIPREIVKCDRTANGGELHFKASSIANASNSDFYLYYGNGDAGDYATSATYGRNNTWTSYDIVFHFQGDPSATAPQLVDVAGTVAGGVTNGSMTSGDEVAGKIGNAWDFDGSNDQVTLGNGDAFQLDSSSNTWSISLWSLRNTIVDGALLFQGRTSVAPYPGFHSFYGTGSPLQIGLTNIVGTQQLIDTAASPSSTATWYHYDWTFNGPSTKINWYYNGVIDASVNNVTTTKTWSIAAATKVSLACYKQHQNQFINGQFDEMRVSSDIKTATWISTTHNNQSSPSTFYSVGSEESAPAPAAGSGLGFGGMF